VALGILAAIETGEGRGALDSASAHSVDRYLALISSSTG
jgi:hypothetical protein